jgi:hypothetical protein
VSGDLRKHLTRAALELAGILNTVMDDDERDELHGHIEKVINDELYAGSLNRRAIAPVIDLMERATRRGGQVVDLFSRRVQP